MAASSAAVIPAILLPLGILYLFNFLVSTWVGRSFFKRDDALALVFGTVLRNLSIALAVAMTAFGPKGAEAAVVISLAYVLQVLAAAWYARLADRLVPIVPVCAAGTPAGSGSEAR